MASPLFPTLTQPSRAPEKPPWQAELRRQNEVEAELRLLRRQLKYRQSPVRVFVSIAFDVYFAWGVVAYPGPTTGFFLLLSLAMTAWAVRDMLDLRRAAPAFSSEPAARRSKR